MTQLKITFHQQGEALRATYADGVYIEHQRTGNACPKCHGKIYAKSITEQDITHTVILTCKCRKDAPE